MAITLPTISRIPGIGVAGENGAGNVRGSAKESSNVDLSVEFVDLMLYQRDSKEMRK